MVPGITTQVLRIHHAPVVMPASKVFPPSQSDLNDLLTRRIISCQGILSSRDQGFIALPVCVYTVMAE
jgi:hypothetical protein